MSSVPLARLPNAFGGFGAVRGASNGLAIASMVVAVVALAAVGFVYYKMFVIGEVGKSGAGDEMVFNKLCFGEGDGRVCMQADPTSKNLIVTGSIVEFRNGASVEGKLHFRHAGANGSDDTDVYHMEKINAGPDINSLRLTINDNADEKFQIWGQSCDLGDCGGAGKLLWSIPA